MLPPTAFAARIVHALGCYAPCTSRLSNRVHSFYVEVDPSAKRKPTEPAIEIKLVSLAQLAQLTLAGEFVCVVISTLAHSRPFKELSDCRTHLVARPMMGANFVIGALEVSWPSKGC